MIMKLIKLLFKRIANLSKLFSRKGLNTFIKSEVLNLNQRKYKALTIGAGGETEAFIKKNKNIQLISIDINQKKKPDIIMDVNNLKFDQNHFDIIFIFEVLEHLPNPQNAIDEIHRVLKKSGKIFLSTPFILEIHGAPDDYYRFTPHGLKYLLKKFNKIEIKERNSYIESINVLLIRLIQSKFISDKLIGLVFLILSFVLYPVTIILSLLIKSKNITTGYVCKAEK